MQPNSKTDSARDYCLGGFIMIPLNLLLTLYEQLSTTYLYLKNVTTLIVNNFYKLEPIVIIFGTLYEEITGF